LNLPGSPPGSYSAPRAVPAKRNQFPGVFCQGQAEGVDSPLHFIAIQVGQHQRIMQEKAFPCLIEYKRPMHEGSFR
jgi:hypothetical protein